MITEEQQIELLTDIAQSLCIKASKSLEEMGVEGWVDINDNPAIVRYNNQLKITCSVTNEGKAIVNLYNVNRNTDTNIHLKLLEGDKEQNIEIIIDWFMNPLIKLSPKK